MGWDTNPKCSSYMSYILFKSQNIRLIAVDGPEVILWECIIGLCLMRLFPVMWSILDIPGDSKSLPEFIYPYHYFNMP